MQIEFIEFYIVIRYTGNVIYKDTHLEAQTSLTITLYMRILFTLVIKLNKDWINQLYAHAAVVERSNISLLFVYASTSETSER